jgi:hypothetical protein
MHKAAAALEKQLERLTEAYLIAVIPVAEYQRRRQELEEKRQSLEIQIRDLATQVKRQAEVNQLATSIQDFCGRTQAGLTQATFDQKRTLIQLLIDRVLVIDDKVEIRYVVPTHPRGEGTRFCHCVKTTSTILFRYFEDRILTGWGPQKLNSPRIPILQRAQWLGSKPSSVMLRGCP